MQYPYYEKAYAKINISLNVINRRKDGYHNLDSNIIFANIYDLISVKVLNTKNKTIKLYVTGPFRSDLDKNPKKNIVYKTALYFMNKYNINKDIIIHLNKKLPIASGIGGGSADAAAILRKLLKIFNIDQNLFNKNLYNEIARDLGADIPACLCSSSLNIKNIGDRITKLPINLKKTIINNNYIILITPNKPISTKLVFHNWLSKPKLTRINNINKKFPKIGINDLKPISESIESSIIVAQKLLSFQKGIQYFGMSGSGSTCYGLFKNHDDSLNAKNKIKSIRPKWWIINNKVII